MWTLNILVKHGIYLHAIPGPMLLDLSSCLWGKNTLIALGFLPFRGHVDGSYKINNHNWTINNLSVALPKFLRKLQKNQEKF